MTVKGQSRARNVPLGPELEKVGREVESYRRFVQLCQQLVEISEQICDLRPVQEIKEEEALDQLKKIAQEVLGEAEAEIERLAARVLGEWQRQGPAGFGSRRASRSREHAPSRRPLAGAAPGGGRGWLPGEPGSIADKGTRRSLKAIGTSSCRRSWERFGCDGPITIVQIAGAEWFPRTGIWTWRRHLLAGRAAHDGTSGSQGTVRRSARSGGTGWRGGQYPRRWNESPRASVTTSKASQNGNASRRSRRRSSPLQSPPAPTMYVAIDGTGVPVRPAEVEGRVGKGGGAAKTREAKLGCVFAQTRCR